MKKSLVRLKRLQRQVFRRQQGSANRRKAIRQLAKTKSARMLEDLHVSGMLHHHLAQAIADVGLYEFRGQLKYKSVWYGCEVLLADRFFPSSKLYSKCGTVKDKLSLGECTYHCEKCGLVMAAIGMRPHSCASTWCNCF